jgi:hypothetical protein
MGARTTRRELGHRLALRHAMRQRELDLAILQLIHQYETIQLINF